MTEEKRNIFKKELYAPVAVEYIEKLMNADEGFAGHVLEAIRKNDLRRMRLSAAEGRILETLVRAVNAKKAVEIGSLAGYSGHWIARGMAESGRLYTLEEDPARAGIARDCFAQSNLQRKVTVLEGAALDTLKTLSKLAPFDFCFMHSDTESYPACLRWAAANLRPGGMVAAAGVFLMGKVRFEGGEPEEGARARALREFFHVLFDGDRFVSASVIPTGEGMALGIRS